MIYTPREDSYLLKNEVKKLAKGKTFLDMGAGSGIQSKTAIAAGAKTILAADINPEAIKHLKSQKIPAIKSNLFSDIKGKFDIIAFNAPYLPEDKDEPKDSSLATTGGKRGDEVIIEFFKKAKSHLADKGIILLVLSSLTPKDKILKLLEKKSLNHKVLASKPLFFETLEVWEITQQSEQVLTLK